MHVPDGSPTGPSLSAIFTIDEEVLTDNVEDYINILHDQHILVCHPQVEIDFSIDTLITLRSFSNLTPIMGTSFEIDGYLLLKSSFLRSQSAYQRSKQS